MEPLETQNVLHIVAEIETPKSETSTYNECSSLLTARNHRAMGPTQQTAHYGCIPSTHVEPTQQTAHYGCIPSTYVEPIPTGTPFSCDELSSTNEMFLSPDERLKRKIKYFFMNPLEKWKTKGKFPWKLLLQVVKIIVVTVQLVVFGNDGYTYELQKQNTGSSFRHIFLKDWLPIREVVSYPPSTGPYAVYTKPEFYANIDHVVKMFSNISTISLGPYEYDSPDGKLTDIQFCRSEFLMVSDENSTLVFNTDIHKICQSIPPLYPEGDERWKTFSFQRYLKSVNDTIKFERLISAHLAFTLRTVFLKNMASLQLPDCYDFQITINYDNSEHDGQILISLKTSAKKLSCKRNGNHIHDGETSYTYRQVLNIFIIFICVLSLLLCVRCLYKGYILCKQTDMYFKSECRKPMTMEEKLDFVDGWYCMMVINDILIVAGSILKACIEQRTVESDQYATCAILLGVGNLLVWAGILRYLGFFRKYNILILTLKKALPNVLRFMLCCVLLYGGFCFCGWIVLGPYHIKFRSLSTTSECLFALMNGDDLFATFAIINTNSYLVWWFSRIYLYLFISMFIYVVISLFISVIMDSYETVKDYYRHGSAPTRIETLVADCSEDLCSTYYRLQKSQKPTIWSKFAQYCRRRNSS